MVNLSNIAHFFSIFMHGCALYLSNMLPLTYVYKRTHIEPWFNLKFLTLPFQSLI